MQAVSVCVSVCIVDTC